MSVFLNLNHVYYKNNRLQQIRGFCNVVVYGSVTEASKVMGLSQSAVTLQIKSLERDLKTKLFYRSKSEYHKRIKLTEEGELFFQSSLPILNSINELHDNFFLDNPRIKIAVHHSAISLFLSNILGNLKKENQNLKFHISYLSKQEALEKITKNDVDIAIYPLENPHLVSNDLTCVRVADYKPALITPKNHPLTKVPDIDITFEDIGKYNYIHTGNYAISDIMKDHINAKILNSDIELNYGSWDMMESLVKAGLGITIFHEDYIKDRKNLDIKRVYHLSPNIAYYAIIKKSLKPKKVVSDLFKSLLMFSLITNPI